MEESLRNKLVHNKENIYFGLALLISVSIYVSLMFSIIGIFIILALITISYLIHAISMASIRRNAVRISKQQFPEVYEKAEVLAKEMGLAKMPHIYVQESMGILNAFATRFFRNDMVVLYSEIFDLIEENKEDELMFVLAHEFAHVKRRHIFVHMLILPVMWIPFLGNAYSRACEYTCDRYAAFYTNNMGAAQNALTILSIGKMLHTRVDQEAYIAQLNEEKGFFAWLSEKLSTHPDLPKRMNNLKNWEQPDQFELIKEKSRNMVILISLFVVVSTAIFAGVFYLVKNSDSIAAFLAEDEFYEDDNYGYVEVNPTALMNAAMDGTTEELENELASDANVNDVDEEASTALFYAMYNDKPLEAVQLLLEAGSDVNAQNTYGVSPLMTAASWGDMHLVELLLEYGADSTLEDSEGYTAYDYASDFDYIEVMNLLEE